jgi:lipopolysaccharide/colanic/teichoic acid biosynthesis glycosyltransferase
VTPILERIEYTDAGAHFRPCDRRWLFSALERTAAALLLVLLSPAMLVIALTIGALSRRTPLMRHLRVGWLGRPLPMLKFRTMWGGDADAPPAKSAPEKSPDDPRITSRFARFCRRHSLDELPQLIHVVRGEMSFVGPRPITAAELEEYYGAAAEEVLSVRPGLTGLWQVRGRSRLRYDRRKRLDLILVRRSSANLYLHVLVCSLRDVLNGRDAW